MASVVVVPLLICLMQFLYICYPLITYMMAGVAALYVPALALVRKPSVTITKDFRVLVRNPKTVDTGLLLKAACSAPCLFHSAHCRRISGGEIRRMFQEILASPQ
jgi:hypothetical protein